MGCPKLGHTIVNVNFVQNTLTEKKKKKSHDGKLDRVEKKMKSIQENSLKKK